MFQELSAWGIRVVCAAGAALLIATRRTTAESCRWAFILLGLGLVVTLFISNSLVRGIGGAVTCGAGGSLAVIARSLGGTRGVGKGLSVAWSLAFGKLQGVPLMETGMSGEPSADEGLV